VWLSARFPASEMMCHLLTCETYSDQLNLLNIVTKTNKPKPLSLKERNKHIAVSATELKKKKHNRLITSGEVTNTSFAI